MNVPNRYTHIDVAKGFGILLVMLGHGIVFSVGADPYLFWTIYAFHMPFWFFISGYLYNNSRRPNDYMLAKIKGLLIPYLIYYSFNVFIRSFLRVSGLERYHEIIKFYGLWFLLTLFIITVSFYVIDRILSNHIEKEHVKDIVMLVISVVFLIVALVYSELIKGKDNVPVATSLVGFFFYELGYLYKKYVDVKIILKISKKRIVRLILLIIGAGLFVALYLLSHNNSVSVDMNTSRYGNPFWFLMNSVIGIIGLYLISLAVNKNRAIEYLGKNSLIILVFHTSFLKMSITVLNKFISEGNAITTIISFLFSLCCSIVAIQIVNRFFPFLTGRIKLE